MRDKGQSALEFAILIGAVIFLFVLFVFGISSNITGKAIERRNIIVEDIAGSVRDEINLASVSSDGYYREFTLPGKALNQEYDMMIDGSVLYIELPDGGYGLSIPVSNVIGQPAPGTNIIKKIDGVVYLNE
ncbi:hypothetical protein COU62_00525 [Candidatus Pacearchaeota archaeon CG10_big_fil_rev_8_21_14_0_10_35_219]|nr:hypothetical protein [Candidatus Pacearchaeota archaeon]OIO42701.1 MAG: hypothetical protein AUJ63_02200 [Candidatus Pacearchaeota archaeon CG1_02_35_32]PIO08275.1 MAG: hypothetical protein COU62_00525 [Candidatus Pacearchaeota archaeon CG10_big_fil_rev_8_21_14_0_10_35_219]PIY81876.1 MAG: hypothetical protein COY79_00265 [Candidatus Pacearchaeota archaeon CG_4_10_14_0_8_um_filter_35_169]PIZ79383.1 MAG: hypothetical protein COY00_04370 [Candidatus Pacearchaeota archaeon CG_4_10_14_0_2_um_filt